MSEVLKITGLKNLTAKVAVGFFLLAALLGGLMRYLYLIEIPFLDYKHVLHAHSHIAILGWGFTILVGALIFIMLPKNVNRSPYNKIIWGNLIAGLGMFIAFLVQGYGPASIAFCVLHLVTVYFFSWKILNDLGKEPNRNSVKFARWSVYWLIISTLGLLAIAPVSSLLGKLHPLYFASIQFFLHMQFNGWFTYGILALIFKVYENQKGKVRLPAGTFLLLQVSLILTYSLSVTWSTPEDFLFYLNSAGVIIQIIAFLLLTKGLVNSGRINTDKYAVTKWLFGLGILSLGMKVIVQGAVALPFIAKVSYTVRNFVIGFIHLSMLGAFSLTIFAFLLHRNLLPKTTAATAGYCLLMVGFILTEAILFIQGIMLWAGKGFISHYHSILFGVTLLLPTALAFIFASLYRKEKPHVYNNLKGAFT